MIPNSDMANLFGSEMLSMGYQPRKTPHFEPERIVITKGSLVIAHSPVAIRDQGNGAFAERS